MSSQLGDLDWLLQDSITGTDYSYLTGLPSLRQPKFW